MPPGGRLPATDLPALDLAQRWRLLLGEGPPPPDRPAGAPADEPLPGFWAEADAVVADLYEDDRRGGLARSSARVTEWLARLREHFPPESCTVMQRDALGRFGLTDLLRDPVILESLEPDVHLAATLIQLGRTLPDAARAKADEIVSRIAAELTRQLEEPLLRAARAALASAELRTRDRPSRHTAWPPTIRRNLKHYSPELGSIVPERFVERDPRARGLRDVHILVDQSASMATSAIYAALGAAVLTRVPALRVRLVAFDTEIADLTGLLHDPIETLFGVQLGGGTDIHRALRYEETYIREPARALLVVLTDLFEGGSRAGTLQRVDALVQSGVRVLVLLAINDAGRPQYDKALAAQLVELGATVFSTTPDAFPELMGRAIRGERV